MGKSLQRARGSREKGQRNQIIGDKERRRITDVDPSSLFIFKRKSALFRKMLRIYYNTLGNSFKHMEAKREALNP